MNVSMDISEEHAEVKLHPKMTYTPTTLEINGRFGKLEIPANEDQLAEIAYKIQLYLDSIRYHETPDQQIALNFEIDQSIEEREIA